MNILSHLLPKNVSGQLMLLVALSLIVAQAINLYILVGESRLRARSNIIETVIDNIVNHVQDLPDINGRKLPYELRGRQFTGGRFYLSKVSSVSRLEQTRLLKGYDAEITAMLNHQQLEYQDFSLALRPFKPKLLDLELGEIFDHRPPPRRFQDKRNGHFTPPKTNPRQLSEASEELVLSIQLNSGIWFNGVVPHASSESLTTRILLSTLALLSITLIGVGFFMQRISKPLSAFANAADEFGRGNATNELRENGPDDIRKAAQAFNRMQRRQSRLLDNHRNMLRAVGHDLRTPLTSLRIRSEMINDELQRTKIINTIDEMTAMTENILSWTKDAAGLEDIASVNLHSLLSSIVDDFVDQGEDIKLSCDITLVLSTRRLAMKRALSNVINNAIRYGHCARVSVVETNDSVLIHIDDNGPGIPEEMLGDALKPFVRLETSRNKDTGGSGLGLSITESIVQTEGGKLLFENLHPNGLRVSLSLPR